VELDGVTVPRVQIVTIEDAMRLRDRALRLPLKRSDPFRAAAREEDSSRQGRLML
jgi:site-specific DNA-methyltransferase (adenine-specific)